MNISMPAVENGIGVISSPSEFVKSGSDCWSVSTAASLAESIIDSIVSFSTSAFPSKNWPRDSLLILDFVSPVGSNISPSWIKTTSIKGTALLTSSVGIAFKNKARAPVSLFAGENLEVKTWMTDMVGSPSAGLPLFLFTSELSGSPATFFIE